MGGLELLQWVDCRPTRTTADQHPIFAALALRSCPQVTGSLLSSPVRSAGEVERQQMAETTRSRRWSTAAAEKSGNHAEGLLPGSASNSTFRPGAVER